MHASIVVGAEPVGGAITLDDAEMGGATELDVAILDRVAAVAPRVVGGVTEEAVERTADEATGEVDVAMTNRSLATPVVASLVEYAMGVLVAAVSSLKEMELTPVLRLGKCWMGWVGCPFHVGVGVEIG